MNATNISQDAIARGEFCKGNRLAGGPNMPRIVQTAIQIANGMAFLHDRGVVHGDLTGGPGLLPLQGVLIRLNLSFAYCSASHRLKD